jgi:hypothetical protein
MFISPVWLFSEYHVLSDVYDKANALALIVARLAWEQASRHTAFSDKKMKSTRSLTQANTKKKTGKLKKSA